MSHQELLNKKFEDFKNGLQKVPPVPCEFKVGDTVTFTNENGIVFKDLEVIGFEEHDDFYGKYIHLNTGAYWFPHSPDELTKQ